ncbi:prolipoprotein diacylglyceryl transferase [Kangiella sp. HZ709]|uniref:prolipoprotein diacylglyceryl transferase n=1 Tax=Kangiella sp. HZ709 TaxID=2666328 RepID=UPI0012B13EC7|nr:prolipoprotein diacylglyceryl transferase [Kangiella sp. HZ709]MRX28089.1 prolipoprotein diacylglyceryl transferase [Kangiella sp. HZ709]
MIAPKIDPVIFSIDAFELFGFTIGPIALHWYGLMYLLGFIAAWLLGNYRANKPNSGWTKDMVADFLFYAFLGVIVGGRFGYVVFYHMDLWLKDFWYLFKIWEGGMSFHGGLIGVAVACWYFARKNKMGFFKITDFIIPLVPLGLLFGRFGNFINGELWGRQASEDFIFGMKFHTDPEQLTRHPSQLYESFFEGLVLFVMVWFYSAKPRPTKAVSGLFLLGYGFFRFMIEYFREPDAHLAAVSEFITRGQVLCLPMIGIGLWLMISAYKQKAK